MLPGLIKRFLLWAACALTFLSLKLSNCPSFIRQVWGHTIHSQMDRQTKWHIYWSSQLIFCVQHCIDKPDYKVQTKRDAEHFTSTKLFQIPNSWACPYRQQVYLPLFLFMCTLIYPRYGFVTTEDRVEWNCLQSCIVDLMSASPYKMYSLNILHQLNPDQNDTIWQLRLPL